jgi:hypothetical protein
MHEARTLFLSLPAAAQTHIRSAINHNQPANLRRLTRAVYPYVQTLNEAHDIADLLAGEIDNHTEGREPERSRRLPSVMLDGLSAFRASSAGAGSIVDHLAAWRTGAFQLLHLIPRGANLKSK